MLRTTRGLLLKPVLQDNFAGEAAYDPNARGGKSPSDLYIVWSLTSHRHELSIQTQHLLEQHTFNSPGAPLNEQANMHLSWAPLNERWAVAANMSARESTFRGPGGEVVGQGWVELHGVVEVVSCRVVMKKPRRCCEV